MKWVIRRQPSDGIATLGSLSIDGVFECFTLEPPTPIDAGTYDLMIDWSQRFSRRMPHVMDVPGHTGIRVHWGNWRKDTEDCTLVGKTEGTDFIGHSVEEFDALFQRLDAALSGGDTATITYVEGGADPLSQLPSSSVT